ncbi:MAG: amidohydrolase [Candidatus Hodarchaeales archaeon]
MKNVQVLGYSKKQNIVIEYDKIIEVGKNAKLPSAEYIIEDKDLFVTPALVNCHTHLPMTLLRGYSDDKSLFSWLKEIWDVERHFGPKECSVGAELAFLEMIKSGTGMFLDFYFNENAIIEPANNSGLRGILGSGIIEGVFLDQGGSKWMLNNAEKVCRSLKQYKLLDGAIAPHSPHTCSEETIVKCLDLADKFEALTQIHVSETREDVLNLQKSKGMPPVEWLDKKFRFFSNRKVIAAHAVWIQQREVEILGKNQAAMAFCPVSGQKLAYGGMAPIPELISEEVSVCLGTDGAASNNTLDLVREMRAGATMISHMRWDPSIINASQILNMAAKNFRQWLFGSSEIKAGSVADITIFNFNKPHCQPVINPVSTLVYSANGADTHSLIVAGKLLMLNQEVFTLNEEKIILKAQKTIQRLLDAHSDVNTS